MENTGQVSESGSSMVKHALNPDKAFMQVHYLKVSWMWRIKEGKGVKLTKVQKSYYVHLDGYLGVTLEMQERQR